MTFVYDLPPVSRCSVNTKCRVLTPSRSRPGSARSRRSLASRPRSPSGYDTRCCILARFEILIHSLVPHPRIFWATILVGTLDHLLGQTVSQATMPVAQAMSWILMRFVGVAQVLKLIQSQSHANRRISAQYDVFFAFPRRWKLDKRTTQCLEQQFGDVTKNEPNVRQWLRRRKHFVWQRRKPENERSCGKDVRQFLRTKMSKQLSLSSSTVLICQTWVAALPTTRSEPGQSKHLPLSQRKSTKYSTTNASTGSGTGIKCVIITV